MLDLERIKAIATQAHGGAAGTIGTPASRALFDCLDEIERLRAALKEIADYGGASNDDAEPCREIARAALSHEQ